MPTPWPFPSPVTTSTGTAACAGVPNSSDAAITAVSAAILIRTTSIDPSGASTSAGRCPTATCPTVRVVDRRLRTDIPPAGERTDVLVDAGVRIEHIVSGEVDTPVDYVQEHDEWILLLEGDADLELGGERHALQADDWIVLPAGVPHRLVRVRPGTRWLAVHYG